MRRRDLIAAFAAAPMVASLPITAIEAAATDQQFLAWWSELNRLEAAAEAWPDDDWAPIDEMFAEVGEIEEQILQTPSATMTAAEVKLRTMIRYFGNTDARAVAPTTHVLTWLEALA